MKPLELDGLRFCRLLVQARHGTAVTPGGTMRSTWLCLCDCGKSAIVRGHDLVQGRQISCGCYSHEAFRRRSFKHGRVNTSEYASWANAKSRCTNTKLKQYKDYGGRGIQMCGRWLDSFEAFLSDMGPCPPGYMLDRRDNDGHYDAENCHWATRQEQNSNTRVNRFIELNGERVTVAEASRRAGVPAYLVYGRLKIGWCVERALGLTAA